MYACSFAIASSNILVVHLPDRLHLLAGFRNRLPSPIRHRNQEQVTRGNGNPL
jgi:hypothetical protein